MPVIKKPINKKAAATKKKRRVRQTFDRFVVLAISTNASGTPKQSTGWTASLRTGTTTVTTDFDEFGVARFPTISTLTTVQYILTLRDENGTILRNFTVPADREFFVARF